jgi:hypothetical protein
VYLRFGAEPELALPPAYLTDRGADLVTELQVPIAPPDALRGRRAKRYRRS